MQTSRDDFAIAFRSAFLQKGAQQKFSLFALITLSIIILLIDTLENKPLNIFRSLLKDGIYRSSQFISIPSDGFLYGSQKIKSHFNIYNENKILKKEVEKLENMTFNLDYLKSENHRLTNLLDEKIVNDYNTILAKIILDKNSPYIKSLILNKGTKHGVKKVLLFWEAQILLEELLM